MIFNPQAKLLRWGSRVESFIDGNVVQPILVEIDPTGYCNAHCPWCRFPNGDKGINIDAEKLMRSIAPLQGLKAINWTGGGEPTLHPDFRSMTKQCNKLGFKQGVFTNGISENHYLDPTHFSWIRFSLTDKYYDALKESLVKEYAKYTTVGIVLCITPENQHHVYSMAYQAKRLGVHYFQVRPALTRKFEDQWVINYPIESLKAMETDSFKIYLSEYKFSDYQNRHPYKQCYGYWFCPVIDHRGDVRVCNYFLFNDQYKLGNIYDNCLSEIISKYPHFIQVTEDCQVCCKNNEINKAVVAAMNVEHPEFL